MKGNLIKGIVAAGLIVATPNVSQSRISNYEAMRPYRANVPFRNADREYCGRHVFVNGRWLQITYRSLGDGLYSRHYGRSQDQPNVTIEGDNNNVEINQVTVIGNNNTVNVGSGKGGMFEHTVRYMGRVCKSQLDDVAIEYTRAVCEAFNSTTAGSTRYTPYDFNGKIIDIIDNTNKNRVGRIDITKHFAKANVLAPNYISDLSRQMIPIVGGTVVGKMDVKFMPHSCND